MRLSRVSIAPVRLARALALTWLALSCVPMQAQDTGQICLQAYADRNRDGQRDVTETAITRGIAASLLNERGVTIDSRLLDDSPIAADGLLCFNQLLAGEYRIIISSSEFIATTATSAEATVRPGTAPARIDFGARSLAIVETPIAITGFAALDSDAIQTLVIAAGSAIIVIVIMALLGVLISLLVIRRRKRSKAQQTQAPVITGLPPMPLAEDESLDPRLTKDPNEGSPLLFTDEDQQW